LKASTAELPDVSNNQRPLDDEQIAACAIYDERVLLEKLGGEPAFAKEVIEIWFEDAPKRIADLIEASTVGDIEAIQMAAHTLKGGAANVGAERFHRLAEKIDLAARCGDTMPAKELGRSLYDELEAVKDLVRRSTR
jgi:HPt (histidine-containing phosphotransfer) domain-containing protein